MPQFLIKEVSILAPERYCSYTTPKYLTVAVPLQVILKPDCDCKLGSDPNIIDYVLPKCIETNHSFTISSSFCNIVLMSDTHYLLLKLQNHLTAPDIYMA